MSKLEGKVAAITGGNSGLGLAIAKRFRAEGASVAIMGRNSETLESAVAEIGEGTVSSRGDVQSLSDLDEFFSKISEHFGSLDIVVANAGGGKIG
ncbi:MAG: oxidoreductase, partial [Gemmatimonadetes bacterium]|nr:oxidoreductase [Gemmatimonadota bacterium]